MCIERGRQSAESSPHVCSCGASHSLAQHDVEGAKAAKAESEKALDVGGGSRAWGVHPDRSCSTNGLHIAGAPLTSPPRLPSEQSIIGSKLSPAEKEALLKWKNSH